MKQSKICAIAALCFACSGVCMAIGLGPTAGLSMAGPALIWFVVAIRARRAEHPAAPVPPASGLR